MAKATPGLKSSMGHREDEESQSTPPPQFYDVEKFREVVTAQQSTPPPKGLHLVEARLRLFVDSILGLLSTFIFMMIVFAAPVAMIFALLYGLVGFLVSFGGIIGGLGFYANRKLGKSARFGDGNLGSQILAQLAGCSLVVLIAYLLIFVVFRLKL